MVLPDVSLYHHSVYAYVIVTIVEFKISIQKIAVDSVDEHLNVLNIAST